MNNRGANPIVGLWLQLQVQILLKILWYFNSSLLKYYVYIFVCVQCQATDARSGGGRFPQQVPTEAGRGSDTPRHQGWVTASCMLTRLYANTNSLIKDQIRQIRDTFRTRVYIGYLKYVKLNLKNCKALKLIAQPVKSIYSKTSYIHGP